MRSQRASRSAIRVRSNWFACARCRAFAWSATRSAASSAAARAAASAGSVAAASAWANRRRRPSQASGVSRPRWAKRRGLDLAEQRVGPQQVALRLLGLVAVQVVDRVAPGAGQEPADVRRDGPVAVEPLQSRGGGQEGGLVRPLGEDDLAGDGQAERVAGRARLDDVEDRPGRRPQRRGQAPARGVAEFGRGREIAARPGAVRGPAEQPGQVGLAVLHAEGAVEDAPARRWRRRARRPGPADTRPRARRLRQQRLGQAAVAERRVELPRLEEGLDPLPGVDREELAAGQAGDDVLAQLVLLQPGQHHGRPRQGLGVGQRLADLQDRVGADHGEPALAQVQLAVALPGTRGVQPDDEGVGLLLEDPGDLAPHLVGRQWDRRHQRGPFFWRLQWISSLTSPAFAEEGLELRDLVLPVVRRDLILPLLDRLPPVGRRWSWRSESAIGASSASGAGSPASARSRGAAPGRRRTRPRPGPPSGRPAASSASGWSLAVDLGHRVEQSPIATVCRGRASTPAAFSRLVSIAAAEVSSLACARCFRAAVASLPTSPVTRASAAWAVLHRGAWAISASVAPIRASDSRTSRTRSWRGSPMPLGQLLDLARERRDVRGREQRRVEVAEPEDLLRPAVAPRPTRPRRAAPAAAAPCRRGGCRASGSGTAGRSSRRRGWSARRRPGSAGCRRTTPGPSASAGPSTGAASPPSARTPSRRRSAC